MFSRCIYPVSWTKGIPLTKKGNLNNVNNYRGIKMISIFAIFLIVLDNRLRKWAENNLLTDVQFGFHKGKSTIDCIFLC